MTNQGPHLVSEIENAPDRLDEMMQDLDSYQGKLGAGPYWAENQRETINWLSNHDLNQFRVYDRTGKGLSNFGGGSRWPAYSDLATERLQLSASFLYRASEKLGITLIRDFYRRRIRDRTREIGAQHLIATLLARLVREMDTNSDFDRVETTLVGAPADLIEIDGRSYTPDFLEEFIRYLEMKVWIDIDAVNTFVEIGPGAGTFAEVMAKLRPKRRLYLIDIPPQLYVTQQVLKAVFPGEVADYRSIKQDHGVLQSGDRRIYTLAPWQIGDLNLKHVDMVYNKAGFSEMRLDTVEAYLGHINQWAVTNVHIRASDLRKRPDGPTAEDYVRLLPNHEMIARIPVKRGGSAQPAEAVSLGQTGRSVSALYFRLRKHSLPTSIANEVLDDD